MQTTRWQPSRVIAAVCLVFTIVLLYVALRLRTYQSSDGEPDGGHISYGLKNKNRILERAKQVRFEDYDGAEAPGDEEEQEEEQQESQPTDAPISFVTDQLVSSRQWYPVDARSARCRKRSATTTTTAVSNVSLIVDFRFPSSADSINQLINRLQSTVGSLIGGSQLGIDELIIVGYGPTTGATLLSNDRRLSSYFDSLKMPRSKLIVRAGKTQAKARTFGVAQSKGLIVVFADQEVIGTVGWLLPLVSSLIEADGDKTIVQPHLDDASRFPVEYTKTPETMVPNYAWPLTIALDENSEMISPSPQIKGRYKSPVIRGNVFGVKRAFFKSIGGYDEKLMDIDSDDSSVATHLELSLRTWMCGGTVLTAPCSRVGLRDLAARRRVSVVDRQSAERIGELWFGNRKEILLNGVVSAYPRGKSRSRRSSSTTGNRVCENIDWYFNTIASTSRVPSSEAVQFGQLRSQTGLCAHVGDDNHVDVIDCPLAVKFERTTSGQLTAGDDGCLTVQTNSFVLVEACHHRRSNDTVEVNDARSRQEWVYDNNRQQLVNPWSRFCAMHVTDPRNVTISWRQIVMAQNCSVEALSRTASFKGITADQFTRWSFVNA